jgi:hypothetical protein
MKSRATVDFWQHFHKLPKDIQRTAKKAYLLWQDNPRHVSLHFKRLNTPPPLYSVRVGMHYRALGLLDDETVVWFWIGTHGEYDRLIG